MNEIIQFASANVGFIIAGAIVVAGGAILFKKLGPKKLAYSIAKSLDNRFETDDGQEKLGTVYDAVAEMYPIIKIFVSEAQFKQWVDEALDKIRSELEDPEETSQD